jgi:hypothetical protein
MKRLLFTVPLIFGFVAVSSLSAQGRSGSTPAAQRPRVTIPVPRNDETCRVWIDGVAAAKQRGPTDCETARRTVPPNGRVLRGDDARDVSERTRTFINSDGLECVEKSKMDRNGRRSYDLKCKEPKGSRGLGRGRGNVPDDRRERTCVDVNRDGRCDEGWETNGRYPSRLPDMIGAMLFAQGRRPSEVTNWLGNGQYQMRYVDANRDRRPERMMWVDSAGQLLQEWVDTNRDGRADSVRVVR